MSRKLVAATGPSNPNRTLHEALDAYADTTKFVSRSTRRARCSRVALLKQHHPDCSLQRLTQDVASRMLWDWQSRPLTRRGTPYSLSFVRQMLGELLRFFTWLDLNDECGWAMPRGLMSSYIKVRRSVRDRQVPKRPSIYTPEQLAVLNHHATPLERLALYVSLNCAMSSSQLGLLKLRNVLLDHQHEYAEFLGFESTSNDSWIRTHRRRTGELGEWRLWPDTTALVKWGVRRARRLGSEYVFVDEEGRPMWNEGSCHSGVRFSNLWTRLVQRVRNSTPDFPAFPIASLRRILPTHMRVQYGSEMSELCLGYTRERHVNHYSARPFGRFHEAMMKAREFFACVFKAIKDDLPSSDD